MSCCCVNPKNIGGVNICVSQSIILFEVQVSGKYEVQVVDSFGNIAYSKYVNAILGQSIMFQNQGIDNLNENQSYIINVFFCEPFKAKYLDSCFTFKTVYYAAF